jgi:hypothetical protein
VVGCFGERSWQPTIAASITSPIARAKLFHRELKFSMGGAFRAALS